MSRVTVYTSLPLTISNQLFFVLSFDKTLLNYHRIMNIWKIKSLVSSMRHLVFYYFSSFFPYLSVFVFFSSLERFGIGTALALHAVVVLLLHSLPICKVSVSVLVGRVCVCVSVCVCVCVCVSSIFFIHFCGCFRQEKSFLLTGFNASLHLDRWKTNELISSFGKRVIFLAENTSFNKHIAFNLLTSFFIKLCSELKYCVVVTVSA